MERVERRTPASRSAGRRSISTRRPQPARPRWPPPVWRSSTAAAQRPRSSWRPCTRSPRSGRTRCRPRALPEPNPRRRPAGTRRVRVMNMVVPHRRVTGSERDRGLTDTDYAENVRVFDMWERWAYDGSSAWRDDMAQEWFGSLGDEQVAVEIRRRPDRGRRTHGNRGRVRSRTAPDARVRQTHRSLLTLPDESERHTTATEAQPRPAAIAARTSGS